MTFTLDPQVAAVLAAAVEQNGPPPAPPVGDVAGRRVALDAMLEYFNNQAQPGRARSTSPTTVSSRPTGPRCSRGGTGSRRAKQGGGAVLARRRDDRRLGTDLRRAGLPVRGPHRRPDAVPGVPARTRAPPSHAGRGRLRRSGLARRPRGRARHRPRPHRGHGRQRRRRARRRRRHPRAATGKARPWRGSCSSTRCSTTGRRRPTPTSRHSPGGPTTTTPRAGTPLLGTGHEHRVVDPPAAPGRLKDAAPAACLHRGGAA